MPFLFVLAAILLRVLPHPWNLTPMGAMFLFSGATFKNKTVSVAAPLAALLVSDYLVVRFVYHSFYENWFLTSPWPAFVLVAMTGWLLRNKLNWIRVAGASVAGSTVFFIASNFIVWMTGALYPVTAAGLKTCFIMAIPFFGNTMLGDLLYAGAFFGGYALLRRRSHADSTVTAPAQ